MLLTLLVFHTYRWKLIFAMIMTQMSNKGQVGEDIRSGPELFLCGYFLCFASHDTTTCRQCLSKLLISIFPDHRFWRWRLNANCPDFALGAVNSWRKQLGWPKDPFTRQLLYSETCIECENGSRTQRQSTDDNEGFAYSFRYQRQQSHFLSLVRDLYVQQGGFSSVIVLESLSAMTLRWSIMLEIIQENSPVAKRFSSWRLVVCFG